jgi:hypothetical protein
VSGQFVASGLFTSQTVSEEDVYPDWVLVPTTASTPAVFFVTLGTYSDQGLVSTTDQNLTVQVNWTPTDTNPHYLDGRYGNMTRSDGTRCSISTSSLTSNGWPYFSGLADVYRVTIGTFTNLTRATMFWRRAVS